MSKRIKKVRKLKLNKKSWDGEERDEKQKGKERGKGKIWGEISGK